MFTSIADFKVRYKFVTDEEIADASDEETLATSCLNDAYNAIRSIFLSRGVDSDKIDEFSRGSEFELDIAVYFFGVRSGWEKQLTTDDRNWLRNYNRLDELKTCAVVLNDGTVVLKEGEKGKTAIRKFNLNDGNISKMTSITPNSRVNYYV